MQGQGLLNGELPTSVYSLFGNHGYYYNGAAKQENTQTTFKASGSADIGSHEVSFGLSLSKDKIIGAQVHDLWTLGRQLANNHILEEI